MGTLSQLTINFRFGAVPIVWYLIQLPTGVHKPGCQSCQGPIIQFFGTPAAPLGIAAEVYVVESAPGPPKLTHPLEPI